MYEPRGERCSKTKGELIPVKRREFSYCYNSTCHGYDFGTDLIRETMHKKLSRDSTDD